jgi:hypothetical protein
MCLFGEICKGGGYCPFRFILIQNVLGTHCKKKSFILHKYILLQLNQAYGKSCDVEMVQAMSHDGMVSIE